MHATAWLKPQIATWNEQRGIPVHGGHNAIGGKAEFSKRLACRAIEAANADAQRRHGAVDPPIFFGANPAEVRHGHAPITRPCGEEEDAARELLLSLDGQQRSAALLCDTAPPDFVVTNAPIVPESCLPGALAPPLLAPMFQSMTAQQREALAFAIAAPRGLPASALNGTQRKLLSELVGVYVDLLPERLAQVER